MATISYGTFTITNELDGSQFWTTTVAPISPDYTFTVSNLVGDTNADIKVGRGHERRGCHKIQLLSSLVTFRTGYKITLSWFSHRESLKLYFC